jgi:hypothetical protein
MRDRGLGFGLLDQPVEKGVVERRVDQAGPWSLQLMAHAARAEDHDREMLGPHSALKHQPPIKRLNKRLGNDA